MEITQSKVGTSTIKSGLFVNVVCIIISSLYKNDVLYKYDVPDKPKHEDDRRPDPGPPCLPCLTQVWSE